MIDWLFDFLSGKPLGARSPKWREIRKEFVRLNSRCAVCETCKKLEVHHKRPFHLFPKDELNPNNLITLCKDHHYTFGHLCNYHSYNKDILIDSQIWKIKIKNRPMD